MSAPPKIEIANTIVYCRRWQPCVAFYRDGLGLAISFENDWFVEFVLNSGARLSVADARRASIESAEGKGITLTLKVGDLAAEHSRLRNRDLAPGKIREHPFGANVFYLSDPDGNRIEYWSD